MTTLLFTPINAAAVGLKESARIARPELCFHDDETERRRGACTVMPSTHAVWCW